MKRKTMSVILRIQLIIMLLLAMVFFFIFLPFYGSELAQAMSEYAWAFWPCLIWAWIFALPLFCAVIPAWSIFGTISEKRAPFSEKNAKRFKQISICFCSSGFIFPIGVIIIALLGAGSAPMTLVVSPIVFIVFNTIAFVCFVMSRLVQESSEIKAENDLTI